VLALFFLIEILPVTVKFLLNIGPPSAYEVVAKLREDELIDAATMRRIETRRIAETESRTRIGVQADRQQKEEDLGKHANTRIASEMTKVLDTTVHEWSRQAREGVPAANGMGFPDPQIGQGFGLTGGAP
jgi:pyruvate/2-oxoglutarate/acetoin dehydrogenase E1 component